MVLNSSLVVAVVLITMAVVWGMFGRKKAEESGMLSSDQIEFIDYACTKAVGYAEQTYKEDKSVDRGKLALEYATDLIVRSGGLPEAYANIITGMIKDAVLQLPQTHEDIVIESPVETSPPVTGFTGSK